MNDRELYYRSDMEKMAFYSELEQMLELQKGTLRGDQSLSDMAEWDSLAVISFIALADSKYSVILQGKSVEACKTVDDLALLIGDQQKSKAD